MNELFNNLSSAHVAMIGVGAFVMASLLIRTVTRGAVNSASIIIEARRAHDAEMRSLDAAAEALGRAASREPLALNADGTIAEPIMAVVERVGIS